jgi:hypothetical protein
MAEQFTFRASSTLQGAGLVLAAVVASSCSDPEEVPAPVPPVAKVAKTSPPPPSGPLIEDSLPSVPGFTNDDFVGQLKPVIEKVDAQKDEGWSSEAFSAAASDQLTALAGLMKSDGLSDGSGLSAIAINAVSSAPLPEKLETVFSGKHLLIRRGHNDNVDTASDQGTSYLTHQLTAWTASLGDPSKRQVEFKVNRVESAQDRVASTVRYHASGQGKNGTIEQTGSIAIDWTAERLPRIVSFRVKSHEEVSPVSKGGLRFADRAPEAFASESAYHDQLSKGIDHWRAAIQADFGVDVNGLQGIAVGDADGDGLEDIYLCQQGGAPNKLFLRQADGSLRDASEKSGADWMELTRGALFADLDNDGDQDLTLTQGWYWMIMENDGQGRFTKRVETKGSAWHYSLAAADYDLDGDLDLYICGRNPSGEQHPQGAFLGTPIPFHDANNGGPNTLLRNEGNWEFTDSTAECGLDANNRRYSYAATWEDYDNDGDQDLYVANDFGRNCLYNNDGGRFKEIAAEAGVEDMSAGMGVAWADYDRDGDMDLHVSNMFSSAGNRVSYQRNFRRQDGASRAGYQRHARGNSLFQNKFNGSFRDVSAAAGITMGRWAWGAQFADLNNDGWEDLYVANGFVTTDDTGDL